ncbi:uncharacterized protein TNIN_20401 [Trichonephila inaurata madagascariensis]|uniref:Uncharacterized protein n=1 Tax=Trichonephila inaurata madagascariensis TaxID=2747483 RepID=A0A8X6MCN1_9ARAC|nr:uncharacterized protein TNIN_20401 [Trichonephila inaurata madagascariensis]
MSFSSAGLDALQMTRVLDMLDEDISHLHQTVHDLEERTLRAMALQSFVMFLIFISGTIGIPMYLGAVWAMYSFSLPKGTYVENFVRTLDEYREANENVPNSEISPLDSSASMGPEAESESQEQFMIES